MKKPRYVSKPKSHSRPRQLIQAFNIQGGKCAYCGEMMTFKLGYDRTATRDHVVPKCKGGPNNSFNIVACDYLCNQRKGNKTLESFLDEITGGHPECHPMSRHPAYTARNAVLKIAETKLGLLARFTV